MAQSLKDRLFGSDLPKKIKQKIQLRQGLSKTSNLDDAFKSVTDPAAVDLTQHNFTEGGGTAVLTDLSSRTPFARMWVALKISDDIPWDPEMKIDGEDKVKEWYADRKREEKTDINWKNAYLKRNNDNSYEVRKIIDFPDSGKIYTVGSHILNTEETKPNQSIGDIVYAPAEQDTDFNQFLKPQTGITDITSESEGPLGSTKRTTVNFVVHNFSDFERIYLPYFLKPGALIFVDYGWDTADLYNPEALSQNDFDNIDNFLFGDLGKVTLSHGDMDTVYGYVVNYDAKIREDGGFDCSVEILSKNSVMFSDIDSNLTNRITKLLDLEILALGVSEISEQEGMGDFYYTVSNYSGVITGSATLQKEVRDHASEFFGSNSRQILPGDITNIRAQAALSYGLFIYNDDASNEIYVNFGWFEDNILNREFGFKNTYGSDFENDVVFNSSGGFAQYNKKLFNLMKNTTKPMSFIYPVVWGGGGEGNIPTYNTRNNKVPIRFDSNNPDKPLTPPFFGPDGYYKNWSEEDYNNMLFEDDKKKNRIPIREIFISTRVIKESIEQSTELEMFLNNIFKRISEDSFGEVDIGLMSPSSGDHYISATDVNSVDSETSDNYITFKPYSPDTIVKEYDLSFVTPKDNIGNMVALQNTINTDNYLSMGKFIDSFIELNNVDKDFLKNKVIRYKPSSGMESSKRLERKYKEYDSSLFGYKSGESIFGEQKSSNMKKRYSLGRFKSLGEGEFAHEYLKQSDEKLAKWAGARTQKLENKFIEEQDKLHTRVGKPKAEYTSTVIEDAIQLAEDSNQKLVDSPTDYYRSIIKEEFKQQTDMMISMLEATLKIYGISGINPGDLINIDYLPKNYRDNVYFQIFKVSHNIGTSWETTLTTKPRIKSKTVENKDKYNSIVINKNWLVKQNLIDIDGIRKIGGRLPKAFIDIISNLRVVDIQRIDHQPSFEGLTDAEKKDITEVEMKYGGTADSVIARVKQVVAERKKDSIRGILPSNIGHIVRTKVISDDMIDWKLPTSLTDDIKVAQGEGAFKKSLEKLQEKIRTERAKAVNRSTFQVTLNYNKDYGKNEAACEISVGTEESQANNPKSIAKHAMKKDQDMWIVIGKDWDEAGGRIWLPLPFDPSSDWGEVNELFSHISDMGLDTYNRPEEIPEEIGETAELGYDQTDTGKGCLDELACNYNSDADEDDGSCEIPVEYCYAGQNKRLQYFADQVGLDLPILRTIRKVTLESDTPWVPVPIHGNIPQSAVIKFQPHIFLGAKAKWRQGWPYTPDSKKLVKIINKPGKEIGKGIKVPEDPPTDIVTKKDWGNILPGGKDVEVKWKGQHEIYRKWSEHCAFQGIRKSSEKTYSCQSDEYVHYTPNWVDDEMVIPCKKSLISGGCNLSIDYNPENTGRENFERARNIDPIAAIASTKWGYYQIPGYYFLDVELKTSTNGLDVDINMMDDPDAIIQAFDDDPTGVSEKLFTAWMNDKKNKHVVRKLKRGNWKAFAKAFYGPNCCNDVNQYDVLLREEYDKIINDPTGILCDNHDDAFSTFYSGELGWNIPNYWVCESSCIYTQQRDHWYSLGANIEGEFNPNVCYDDLGMAIVYETKKDEYGVEGNPIMVQNEWPDDGFYYDNWMTVEDASVPDGEFPPSPDPSIFEEEVENYTYCEKHASTNPNDWMFECMYTPDRSEGKEGCVVNLCQNDVLRSRGHEIPLNNTDWMCCPSDQFLEDITSIDEWKPTLGDDAATTGCMDPYATNYDPGSMYDSGECRYTWSSGPSDFTTSDDGFAEIAVPDTEYETLPEGYLPPPVTEDCDCTIGLLNKVVAGCSKLATATDKLFCDGCNCKPFVVDDPRFCECGINEYEDLNSESPTYGELIQTQTDCGGPHYTCDGCHCITITTPAFLANIEFSSQYSIGTAGTPEKSELDISCTTNWSHMSECPPGFICALYNDYSGDFDIESPLGPVAGDLEGLCVEDKSYLAFDPDTDIAMSAPMISLEELMDTSDTPTGPYPELVVESDVLDAWIGETEEEYWQRRAEDDPELISRLIANVAGQEAKADAASAAAAAAAEEATPVDLLLGGKSCSHNSQCLSGICFTGYGSDSVYYVNWDQDIQPPWTCLYIQSKEVQLEKPPLTNFSEVNLNFLKGQFDRLKSEHQTTFANADLSSFLRNISQFARDTRMTESSGKHSAMASTNYGKEFTAKGIYQFTDASVDTGKTRMKNVMTYDGGRWFQGWDDNYIKGIHLDPTNWNDTQADSMFLANIFAAPGSDESLIKIAYGEPDSAIQAYYDFHHTKPDDQTKKNAKQWFKNVNYIQIKL